MQIQVNTDRNIEGNTRLTDEVETIVQQAFARYGDRITRVEVFLSDENSGQKFGDSDKRCVIEARLGGLPPVTVSHHGSSLDQAVGGATALLGELPKVQRRAFVLNVLEAYDISEIAMLQDRLEKDVRDDIQAARNQLRERLRARVKSQSSAKQTIGDEV